MSKAATRNTPDTSRLNPEVLKNTFKKGDFMACLIELIKNATDANATHIWITTADRRQFVVADNGNGMDARGRQSYLNAGYSTGDGTTSAKFGTGARMFPFSFASYVTVSTVSAAEPSVVYQCEFTPDELIQYYFHQRDIHWQAVRKTGATWGHDHPTGSVMTYTLSEDPTRKRNALLRGATLMRRLTDRLDIGMVESDMFLVDGKRLPKKQYAEGTRPLVFEFDNEDIPGMGYVKLELYRPAKPSRATDLLMAARTVGEVSFRNKFVRLLPDLVEVPPLYLQSGVCGLITADYLNNYVAHQRDEFQGVEDDERTYELLRLMASVQAEAAEALGIKLREQDEDDAAGRKEVTALLDSLDSHYNQGQVPPPAHDGEETEKGSGGKKTGGSGQRHAYFRLNQTEFEPGETIKATLVVPHGSAADYVISHNDARAKVVREEPGSIELVAETVGLGRLMARHRHTGAVVRVRYQILAQRWFWMQVSPEVAVGQPVVATIVNPDKAPGGKIAWELVDGPGKLTVNASGRSAVFVSDRIGFATIRAYAEEAPNTINDERDIQVTRQDTNAPRAFCIRGEFFVPRFDGVMGQVQFSKPVTIIRNAGNLPHRLTFTPDEPGYAKAYREGNLALYLIPFIAREFADHFSESDGGDAEVLQWEVSQLAAEVAAEMYGAKVVE